MKRSDVIRILEAKRRDAINNRNDADLIMGDSAAFARRSMYAGQVEALDLALGLVRGLTPDPVVPCVKPVIVVPADDSAWPF